MDYHQITNEREHAWRVVTLQRPDRRNALSLEMMRELTAALEEAAADLQARAVILAAAGPVFCAGHDLVELRDRDEGAYREIFEACSRLMETVQSIRVPVIAAVQGVATAAGCQLVAACDLAIASDAAWFATPGVKIGLFCSTPMVALTRAIGRKRALEMLLTGRQVAAAEAAAWGLVNRVVPPEQLRAATRQLAAQVADASALTIATGKYAFYRQIELPQREAYALAQETMTRNALAADAQEGICAFLEKRPARWSGN
jgi:enoyl-CoA hydratase/carnithine racemase